MNEQIQKCKHKLCSVLAANTGKPYEEVLKDMDRDFWMSADEAQAYGLVDKVFTNKGIL